MFAGRISINKLPHDKRSLNVPSLFCGGSKVMDNVTIGDGNVTEESVLCTQEKQKLKFWGLPESILKQYEKRGVVSMFPWQVECLCCGNVLKGGNLVYSAPTSAGKTLVAEILTIKTVLERRKKVIIILPFVSVVREKMFYFKDLLSGCAMQVAGLMGSSSLPGGFKRIDIAICTIEKANSLINRLLEEGSLHKVGAVIVDELHLLGDPFRGYLLELLLTKILYMQKMSNVIQIQVVGMSATLPNLDLLASWLSADLYTTDFRPVPLQEFLKVDCTVYDSQLKKLYNIQPAEGIQDDPDHVVQLCLETVIGGHSVLVFCATKNWCEKLATHIAQIFRTVGFSGGEMAEKIRKQLNSAAILEAMEQLQRCPVGIDKVLRGTIAFGVAFHHAGLTLDERDIIEGCFRAGTLRVIVATSTLSSGVNLPAHRVLIRSPVFHGKPLDAHTYRQMIGRAGRMGHDTAGESFLLCHKSEQQIGERLVKAKLTPVESCLGHSELTASLKRAILEVIASGVASTPEQVSQYTSCTLLATSKPRLENPVSACVHFLEKNEFIRLQQKEEDGGQIYVPTPLGLACLAASLPPDEGLQLFDELSKARQCFVLDTDLHVVYEVTPYSVSMQWGNLDWLHIMNLWEELPATMKRVGELVGVDERFMIRAMRGTLSLNNSKQLRKMSIHRRFYTALALHELVNEVPLNVVASKFGCSRGMLQSLQQSAATFAGMVTAFCRRLGWSTVELVISQFQDRLQFGVQRELCDLMRLDNLNGQRARALFNAGITSISELAAADVNVVENILHTAVPFQSAKEIDGETTFETEQRNKLRAVWITGKHGLTEREAANMLISDARTYLEKELGLTDAKWDAEQYHSSVDSSDTNNTSSISSLASLSSEGVLNNENEMFPLEGMKLKAKNLEAMSEEECLAASPVSNISLCCSKEMKQSKKRSKKCHTLQNSKKSLLSTSSKSIKNTQIFNQKNNNSAALAEPSQNNNNNNKNAVDSDVSKNCNSGQQIDKGLDIICIEQNGQTYLNKQNMEDNSVSLKITESFFKNVDMKVENIEKEFSKKAFIKSKFKNEQSSDRVLKSNGKSEKIKKDFISFDNKSEEHILKFIKASEIQRNLNMSHSPCDKVVETAEYKSPSLFGDSFTLDSQLDEVLADCHDSFNLQNDRNSAPVQNSAATETTEGQGNAKTKGTETGNENHGRNIPSVKDVSSPDVRNYNEIVPLMNNITDSKGRKGIVLQLPESPPPEILHSVHFEDINFESLTINSAQVCHSNCETASNTLHFENVVHSSAKKRKLQGEMANSIQNTKRKKIAKENNTAHVTVTNKEDSLNSNEVCNISSLIKDSFLDKEIHFSENLKLSSKTDDITINCGEEKSTRMEENSEKFLEEEHDSIITDSFLEKAFDTYLNMSLQTVAEISAQDCDDNVDSPAKVHKNSHADEVFDLSDKRILEEAFISSWNLEQDSLIRNTSNLTGEQYIYIESPELLKQKKISGSSERKNKQHTVNNRRRSPRLIEAANGSHHPLEPKVRNSNSSPLLDNKKEKGLFLDRCVQHQSTPKLKVNKVLRYDSENSIMEKDDLIISSQETTSAKTSRQKGNLPRRKKYKSQKASTRSSAHPTNGKEDVPENSNNNKNDPENTVDSDIISIIDVCKNKEVWTSFHTELHRAETEVAMAIACERYESVRKSDGGIGAKVMRKPGHKKAKASSCESVLCHGSLRLVGIAFCFGGKDVYYVNLKEGESISINERLDFLRTVLSLGWELRTFDLKEQIKVLFHCCSINVKLSTGHDPKIADWLLEPDGREKTLHAMGLKYCTSELCKFLNLIDSSLGTGSPALDLNSDTSGRLRSCVEAVLVWEIVEAQQVLLDELGLKTAYSELEMPTLFCLIRMELYGIGFDRKEAERLRGILEQQMASLETKAYRLAGHTFSLTSSADIAKVLFRELKLASGKSSYKQRRQSTSKEALMRLKGEHPLPELILQWRKLNALMTKTVFPLLRAVQNDNRIFGCSVMHTATGRISMHEPNLQNIPRDFEVVIDSVLKGATGISMRTAFIPQQGKVLISADYCQLELRLLAHLAKDDTLCTILNSGEDVFCNIASSWKKIPAREVTQCQRQWAKQICYGMIYGIGAKALSEQLGVEEEEAAVYMDTFKNSYPGVKGFLTDTVSRCRKEGYIETLMGRRRYLPSIYASHCAARAHAERQAINSTVQGSAADVVKRGMVLVEKRLLEAELASPQACLVLHLHDELLYEVPQEKSLEIARLIRGALESAVILSVKLPVKVKVGNSWGSLAEITL